MGEFVEINEASIFRSFPASGLSGFLVYSSIIGPAALPSELGFPGVGLSKNPA